MELHTRPDDLCYEPFSGSGSQLIAAEQLGRRCYAIELEPRFVDVAISRWERLTGKKAEVIAEEVAEENSLNEFSFAGEGGGGGEENWTRMIQRKFEVRGSPGMAIE